MKLRVAACVAFVALCGGAHGESLQDALREFGWEGTWSRDCSISPHDFKTALPRVIDVIPLSGPPTRTLDIKLDGKESALTYTVTSAAMLPDQKIAITYSLIAPDSPVLRDEKFEDVVTRLNGKMVTLQEVTSGFVKRDLPPLLFSKVPLKAGDRFEFTSAKDGFTYDPSGKQLDPATLEKCRDQ